VTSGETFAAQAGELLFGPAGGPVFAWIVIVAVLGSLLGLLMALPRVYYGWPATVVFFKSVPHCIRGSAHRPVRCDPGDPASIIVASGTFNQIIAYFVFVTVLFVGLTVQDCSGSGAGHRTPRTAPGGIPLRRWCFSSCRRGAFLVGATTDCRPRSVSASSPLGCQSTIYFFVEAGPNPNPSPRP